MKREMEIRTGTLSNYKNIKINQNRIELKYESISNMQSLGVVVAQGCRGAGNHKVGGLGPGCPMSMCP